MAPVVTIEKTVAKTPRLPSWFRQDMPDMKKISEMKNMFRKGRLSTVCESARCPNMGKCWGQGVATFMILGDVCSRACRFCAVNAGRPLEVDTQEPEHVALAVKELALSYVVITSVARDDLEDEGAGQFCKTVKAVRTHNPLIKIELLIPDFSCRKDLLKSVVESRPEVLGHNIETVERLSEKIRPQAGYRRSLEVLRAIKDFDNRILTKSSLMLGLGETQEEVIRAFDDLLKVNCDILTIGQYLSPSKDKRHLPVLEYIHPDVFDDYTRIGKALGFKHVMSGPLVRSSYIAEEGYKECMDMLNSASVWGAAE